MTIASCAVLRGEERRLGNGGRGQRIPEEELTRNEERAGRQEVRDHLCGRRARRTHEVTNDVRIHGHLGVERDERHRHAAVEHALHRRRVDVHVPLRDRRARLGVEMHVARYSEGASHDHDAIDVLHRVGCLFEREGEVGQGTEGQDGDRWGRALDRLDQEVHRVGPSRGRLPRREDAAVAAVGLTPPLLGKCPNALRRCVRPARHRSRDIWRRELDQPGDVARSDRAVHQPCTRHRDRGDMHRGVLQEVQQRHRVVGPTIGVDDDRLRCGARGRVVRRRARRDQCGCEQHHRCRDGTPNASHEPIVGPETRWSPGPNGTVTFGPIGRNRAGLIVNS